MDINFRLRRIERILEKLLFFGDISCISIRRRTGEL